MSKPIVQFTMMEAMKHYKGDPVVKCLADDVEVEINSSTIHSEKYEEYPEPWIWAHSTDPLDPKSVLLYAPGHFNVKECEKAEIIPQEEGEEDAN